MKGKRRSSTLFPFDAPSCLRTSQSTLVSSARPPYTDFLSQARPAGSKHIMGKTRQGDGRGEESLPQQTRLTLP